MKSLIVVGGGAAGFFCAVNAARLCPDAKIILLEKSGKLLSKVKVSGGGRCNVTHHHDTAEEMAAHYPRGRHFVRKAFHHFSPPDTVVWFEERGVKLKIEKDGRMFPVSDSSQTVIDCLLREGDKYGVQVAMNADIIGMEMRGENFVLTARDNRRWTTGAVCIATGGGPKGSAFELLLPFGHTVEPLVPSLFTFNAPKHPITELQGVSVPDAEVQVQGTKLAERGPLLITHWGVSGPAVLRTSAWGARELAAKDYRFEARIKWAAELEETALRAEWKRARATSGSKTVGSLPNPLPGRLWHYLLENSGNAAATKLGDWTAKGEAALIELLFRFTLPVQGKTTFKEEFVTAGGVKLSEVSSSTMESKRMPGLYLAGEVLDVDGITGGYNFQHAWTSGYLAAQSFAVAYNA